MWQLRDDADFNINLCELVEKQPALYDCNRLDYPNRKVQDKLWEQIGKELSATAHDCKERWKNIKGRYGKLHKKTILSSGTAATKVKEYYLAPHLTFINNFLKLRPPKRNIQRPIEMNDDNSSSENEENSTSQFHLNATSPRSNSTLDEPTPTPKTNPSLQDVNNSVYEYFTAKKLKMSCPKAELDSDSDLCFLKSLLPDMRVMTAAQKRRFKIEVLSLAGNILTEN